MALDGPVGPKRTHFPGVSVTGEILVCFSRSASCSLHAPGRHGDCFPTPHTNVVSTAAMHTTLSQGVKRFTSAKSELCPLSTRSRPNRGHRGTSVSGHQLDSCSCNKEAYSDHLCRRSQVAKVE